MISNGKITAPVDFLGNIAITLGEKIEGTDMYSGDIGTLCKSDKVNMWSKIKPLRINSPSIEINQDRLWQSAPDYKAGIKVTPVGNVTDITNIYGGTELSCFSYDQPRDGDWFRAFDFDGYHHHAINPFGRELYCPKRVMVGENVPLYITERVYNSDSVQMEDMEITGQSIGEYFFGFFFSGTRSFIHTNDRDHPLVTYSEDGHRMLNEYINITATNSALPVGGYTAYPLISLDPFTDFDPIPRTGTFLDLQNIKPVYFQIVSDGYVNEGLCEGQRIDSNTGVRFKMAFSVLKSEGMRFEGRYILCDPDGNGVGQYDSLVVDATGGDEDSGTPVITWVENLETARVSGTITQDWYVKYQFNFQNGEYLYEGRVRIV